MPHSLTESIRAAPQFSVLIGAFSIHSRFPYPLTCAQQFLRSHSHLLPLDYVQAPVLADSIRAVALQIDQHPVEAPGAPSGPVGTLGEVVIVAPQVVLAAVELLLRGLLQAVPHGLQDDTYPTIKRGQMRLPQDRCDRILRQRVAHPFR